jgi:uncharacterized protein YndB with AHSA1/START domain
MLAKKSVKKTAKKTTPKVEKPKKIPVGKGPIGYTTSNVFKQPLKKVWEGAVLSKYLKKYFVDDMRGEFTAKLEPVEWFWKEWGWWTIQVAKFVKNKEVVMLMPDWENKYLTTVRFEFLRKDGKTIFRVHESGYPTKHLKQAFMMCEGWTEFHTYLKAYLLTGKDVLRKG